MTDTSMPRRKSYPHRTATSHRINKIPESSTVAIADMASALRRRGEKVIDFSAGRAAESTHEFICAAGIEAMTAGETHQTDARGIPEYLAACADKLKRENNLSIDAESEVMATLGCKEGLLLALFAVLDPGDEVIVEDPRFVSYGPEIELCGGTPIPVLLRPEHNYRWTLQELQAAVTPRTKAIVLCSPNNPLGVVHTREDLDVIRSVATEANLTVIADEIYDAAVWGGRRHLPIASLPGMRERTIGLMGMTKSYSMGGWRLGYAYAPDDYISKMVVVQQHIMTCASSIGQRAGIAALSEEGIEYMRPLWSDWEKRCMYAADEVNKIPLLSTERPEGTFYCWVDISATGLSSGDFAERLLHDEKVAVVPGGTFGAQSDAFIRLTCVRSWKDLEEGIERLASFVDSL